MKKVSNSKTVQSIINKYKRKQAQAPTGQQIIDKYKKRNNKKSK